MSKKAIKQSPLKTNKQINKHVLHVRASEQKMLKIWKHVWTQLKVLFPISLAKFYFAFLYLPYLHLNQQVEQRCSSLLMRDTYEIKLTN